MSSDSPSPEDCVNLPGPKLRHPDVRSSFCPQLRGHPEVDEAVSAGGAMPSRGQRKYMTSRTCPYEAEC